MRFLIAAALAWLTLCAGPALAAPEPVIGPAPAWVKPTAPYVLPKERTNAPFRSLRLHQQINFGPEGVSTHVETVILIQTSQGLGVTGAIALPWSPDSDTLTIHRLEVRRGDEVIDVLEEQTFTILRREGQLEYAVLDGMLTATIQPEGVEVGDVLVLSYTLTRKDDIGGTQLEYYIGDIPDMPVDDRSLRVTWDGDRPIRWRLDGGMKPPKVIKTKGRTELVFDVSKIEAVKLPVGAPARYGRPLGVELTEFTSWSEISTGMWPLYEKAAVIAPGSRLRGEVDKIKAATTDPKKRAELALSLVQDRVRYVYLGMDSGNLTPASAEQTWSRRYGDCKGKTALLLAILRDLGIEAEAAVVNTEVGDGLNERLPLIGLFDHVLVRAVIDGKVYWLDGTRTGDGRLDAIQVPNFHWALPLRERGADLVALVVEPMAVPVMQVEIDMDASGGIYGRVKVSASQVLRGDMAVGAQGNLAALEEKQRTDGFKALWAAIIPGVDVDTAEYSFDKETGELRLTMVGTTFLGWDEKDSSAGVKYVLGASPVRAEVNLKRGEGQDTTAPYANVHPIYVSWRQTVKLPLGGEGFRIEGDDINSTLGGTQYVRKARIEGDVAIMENTARSLKPEFPASEGPEVERAMKALVGKEAILAAPPGYRWTAADTAGRIEAYDKAIKEHPEEAELYAGRASMHSENKAYDKAEADLTKAIEHEKGESLYYTARAEALLRQGKAEAAMADFAAARTLAAKDATKLNNLCWAQATNNVALEAALGDCDAGLRLEPRSVHMLDSRGFVLMRMGRFAESIADYDKALGIRPDEPMSLFGRGLARIGAGDKAGGEADLAAARKLDPKVDEDFAEFGLKAPQP
ncbi:MAG: DUF3857 domain-containing protein [Caulobacter sp.]